MFKTQNKVVLSHNISSVYVAKSTQLLDHLTGKPINDNCTVENDIPLQSCNNVEQDSHLDASSEGGGSTVTSVTFNTSQELVQDKDSEVKSNINRNEQKMKRVTICLKRVHQTKVNTSSKQNLAVMHRLKSEKEHLLKKVQQLIDEKMFYKTKLEEHVGQNNMNYLQEEILDDNISPPDSDSKARNEGTYDETVKNACECKCGREVEHSKQSQTLMSNPEDTTGGNCNPEETSAGKSSDAENNLNISADNSVSSQGDKKTEVSHKRKHRLPICILCQKYFVTKQELTEHINKKHQ